jgi:predicted small lipoprotein YifL
MKRALKLTVLLIMTLSIAACGGGEPQQSDRAAPTEPQQTRAESTPDSVQEEATQRRVPAGNEAAESEQGSTTESKESSGLSVRTIEGKEAMLGGQGDVTALFFMAGW